MPTKQGDVSMLNDPVAQQLLQSQIPARLAYVWRDGTPRVIPIAFHWDGKEIVMGTPPPAPKLKVINNKKVAITIDNNTMPYKVLYIRGTASVTMMDGIVPEYALAVKRYFGDEAGEAWLNQIRPMFRRWRASPSSPNGSASWTSSSAFPAQLRRRWLARVADV